MAYNSTSWTADGLSKATNSTSTDDSLNINGTLTVGGASTLSSTLTIGVNDTGYDVKFFGATSGSFMLWDESDDALELTDSSPIKIGDGGDMTIYHDGSHSYVTNATGTLKLATESSGIAVSIGHTTSETTVNDNLTVTGTLTVPYIAGNTSILGDLTVTGGDCIFTQDTQITLNDDSVAALQIGSDGQLDLLKFGTSDAGAHLIINGDRANAGIAVPSLDLDSTGVISGNHDDGYVGSISIDSAYAGGYTVTRHNYISLENISLTSSAAVTDACVFSFNANKGTHKAIDSGSAHPDIDTADAWMKININGTVHYIPCYTDKS